MKKEAKILLFSLIAVVLSVFFISFGFRKQVLLSPGEAITYDTLWLILIPIVIIVVIVAVFLILRKAGSASAPVKDGSGEMLLKARQFVAECRRRGYSNREIHEMFKNKNWTDDEVYSLLQ